MGWDIDILSIGELSIMGDDLRHKKMMTTLLISILVGILLPPGVGATESLKGSTTRARSLTVQMGKRNPALAISAESVLKRLEKREEITLVDVRRREEYEKFHIPGSIHIPLFAVKTKAFLKTKPLVLINEGHSYSQLERECELLRRSGFTAWVLSGGLNYWRVAGAPLTGDLFARQELNRMEPRDFYREKDYANWLIINAAASKSADAYPLISKSIAIPQVKDEKEFNRSLKRAIEKPGHRPLVTVLIFDEKGEKYDEIEKLVPKAYLKNIFFLKGGLEAYRKFVKNQSIYRYSKSNPRRFPGDSASCP